MKALLIVDMIHDFVDGKFGSPEATAIVNKIADFSKNIRESGGTVVYLKDSHSPEDPEIKIWGPHAMKGTWGSEIVENLKPYEGDLVIEKSTYNGFLFTNLAEELKKRNVDEVLICGVATDICVLHTAFGAFSHGFKVKILADLCAGTSKEMHEMALEYMKKNYGAEIIRGDSV